MSERATHLLFSFLEVPRFHHPSKRVTQQRNQGVEDDHVRQDHEYHHDNIRHIAGTGRVGGGWGETTVDNYGVVFTTGATTQAYLGVFFYQFCF